MDDPKAARSSEVEETMIGANPLLPHLSDAQETRQLQVEVVGGPMDGQRHAVTQDVLVLGRSAECDFPLVLDSRISGTHARIVKNGSQFALEDLDSRNGTYVGNENLGTNSDRSRVDLHDWEHCIGVHPAVVAVFRDGVIEGPDTEKEKLS